MPIQKLLHQHLHQYIQREWRKSCQHNRHHVVVGGTKQMGYLRWQHNDGRNIYNQTHNHETISPRTLSDTSRSPEAVEEIKQKK